MSITPVAKAFGVIASVFRSYSISVNCAVAKLQSILNVDLKLNVVRLRTDMDTF